MTETLLPRHATPFERALESATAPIDQHEVLHTLALPDRIPAASLPWLAWGEDVPHWPDAEVERRDVTARSHRLHGLIGTAAGLREGARLTGARVTHIDAPPCKTFLGGRDEHARRRWLNAQPQLRLYPRRIRAAATGAHLGHDALGAMYPVRTDARFRATLRATLVHRGQETELSATEWETDTLAGNATLRLTRPAPATGAHLGHDALGAMYPVRTDAAARMWSIDQQTYQYGVPTARLRTLAAGFEPLSADVECVAERTVIEGLTCLGRGCHLGAAHPARAWPETRLYWRTWLHDPAIAAPLSNGLAFLGRTRLGMPAFEIHARLALAPRRDEAALLGAAGPHYPAGRDTQARIDRSLDVLAFFRAGADRVLIDTRNHNASVATPTLLAGSIRAGDILTRT